MIKLLVNLPRHKAGSVVTAAQIGEVRAQRLLDAGQAVPFADQTAADALTPVERVMELIADARGFFAGFADRLKVVVVEAASLDDGDRVKVAVELRELLLEQEPEEPGALAELLRLAEVQNPDAAKVEGGSPPDTSGGQDGSTVADQAAADRTDEPAATEGAPPPEPKPGDGASEASPPKPPKPPKPTKPPKG